MGLREQQPWAKSVGPDCDEGGAGDNPHQSFSLMGRAELVFKAFKGRGELRLAFLPQQLSGASVQRQIGCPFLDSGSVRSQLPPRPSSRPPNSHRER